MLRKRQKYPLTTPSSLIWMDLAPPLPFSRPLSSFHRIGIAIAIQEMDPTLAVNRAEAERSLAIAAKLLAARDLVGSKRFAELALDAEPRLADDRADQILAVADVLLASQKRINSHLDWYSILQLPHPGHSPNSNSNSNLPNSNPNPNYLLKCQYRRLSLLLHPDRNRYPGADAALGLVVDAYNGLSDPAKRSIFDTVLRISFNLPGGSSTAAGGDGDAASFWTLCPSCYHVHQYGRAYLNKTLRCQSCRGAFNASELQALPTIVPGTDTYYATWGFFPLGFANPGSTDWKPFASVYPGGGGGLHQNQNQLQADGTASGGGGRGSAEPDGRNKKKTARKKVMGRPKSRMFGNQVDFGDATNSRHDNDNVVEEEARGININEAAKGIGEDDIEMIIDLDGTDDMLGNLHNLPFLKDDGINLHGGGF